MRIGVVFIGTDAVRILSKGVGQDRPQYRVTTSTGVGRLSPAGVGQRREADEIAGVRWYGAMQQTMRGMMPILSLIKVGRDRPQLCARESSHLFIVRRKHTSCPVRTLSCYAAEPLLRKVCPLLLPISKST